MPRTFLVIKRNLSRREYAEAQHLKNAFDETATTANTAEYLKNREEARLEGIERGIRALSRQIEQHHSDITGTQNYRSSRYIRDNILRWREVNRLFEVIRQSETNRDRLRGDLERQQRVVENARREHRRLAQIANAAYRALAPWVDVVEQAPAVEVRRRNR